MYIKPKFVFYIYGSCIVVLFVIKKSNYYTKICNNFFLNSIIQIKMIILFLCKRVSTLNLAQLNISTIQYNICVILYTHIMTICI